MPFHQNESGDTSFGRFTVCDRMEGIGHAQNMNPCNTPFFSTFLNYKHFETTEEDKMMSKRFVIYSK